MAIVAFAIALRLHMFGDPIAGVDEQFYLLVGDRMVDGAVPYVDIWDRKPAGLFLIYAACQALSAKSIIMYRIVATISLVATAWFTASIARRIASPAPATAAGLIVVFYGVFIGVGFGEALTFYDLPVAAAAWLIQRRRVGIDRFRADLVMLLAGVAITIKPSAVFEGLAFGLILLQAEWNGGSHGMVLIRQAFRYCVIGIAPSAMIAICYAASGHFGVFWFANVLSILHKQGGTSSESMMALVACLIVLAPIAILAIPAIRHVPSPDRHLLALWLVASIIGFCAIGFFHFHYALPIVCPLAILASCSLGRWGGRGVAVLATLVGVFSLVQDNGQRDRDTRDVAHLASMIPASVRRECLFVYEGPMILYHLTDACLPGRYVFPGHFTDPAEANALERPSSMILRQAIARAPAAIISAPGMRDGGELTSNDRIVGRALARGYRAIGSQSVRLYGDRRVTAVVWARR